MFRKLLIMFIFVVQCPVALLAAEQAMNDPHAEVFKESNYPSATACASCHPKVFAE